MPVTVLKRGTDLNFSTTFPLGKEKFVFTNKPRHQNTLEVCLLVWLLVVVVVVAFGFAFSFPMGCAMIYCDP